MRFKYHLDRIKNNQDIHLHNPDAKISFISSDDAARSLKHIGENRVLGPINCCNTGSISVGSFLNEMASSLGAEVKFAKERNEKNASPYRIEEDWFMSNELLLESGLNLEKIIKVVKNLLIK